MKPHQYVWHAVFTIPLFLLGWLVGEVYLNLRAGYTLAKIRAQAD